MIWAVELADELEAEWDDLSAQVQDEILAHAKLLERFGPQLGRPRVDTLNGSKHSKMKELRFDAAGGVWRVAFAFDADRIAVLLIALDKAGTSKKLFYKRLVKHADKRFDAHLARVEEGDKDGTRSKRKARRALR